MTFDPSKPCQTRDGRKARVICTDINSDNAIAALITVANEEVIHTFASDGRFRLGEDHPNDLINIPERIHRELWMNVYGPRVYGPRDCTSAYESRKMADEWSNPSRLACVKVTIDCVAGEGLNGEEKK